MLWYYFVKPLAKNRKLSHVRKILISRVLFKNKRRNYRKFNKEPTIRVIKTTFSTKRKIAEKRKAEVYKKVATSVSFDVWMRALLIEEWK